MVCQENRGILRARTARAVLRSRSRRSAERFLAAGLGLRGDRKKSMFRINRDVRFSKDKRPYNQHLSAILSPDGTKMEQGVSLHLHRASTAALPALPGGSRGPELLQAMRKAIIGQAGYIPRHGGGAEEERSGDRRPRSWMKARRVASRMSPTRTSARRSATGISPSGTISIPRRSIGRPWSTTSSISRCELSRCSTGAGLSRGTAVG